MPKSTSIWLGTAHPELRPALTANAEADVCVIGAGLAGVTTAYLLAVEGRSVILLDDGTPGCGQTGVTTAHLSDVIDDRYTEMIRLHGIDGARLASDSHRAAIERLENANVEGFTSGPCLHFPRQGQFHPLKYLNGVLGALVRAGGRLYGGTRAVKVSGGTRADVETASGAHIRAAAVVVATNVPFIDLVAIHTKQAPYHSYVIAARVAPGAITPALYWDTHDPYHYVRIHRVTNSDLGGDNGDVVDLLIVGGEDHKAGHESDAEARYGNLERWMRPRFPAAGDIEFRWSGQVMETQDGLAFIGRNPMDAANVYVATGDSGMGMTHGTIAAMLLTDLIQSRPNRWADLY